jgi:membrane protease YdiL (CAAX protease family)
MNRSHLRILVAVAFELGLGAVGWAIARGAGLPIADRLGLTAATAWRCTLGLIPMLVLLAVAMNSTWTPLARLHHLVRTLAREVFGAAAWWQLAAVSLAAGVGEELLFRGALQPLAERWLGAAAGLIAASILFGALHAASITYFVLATAVGLYLGWLAQRYDDLVSPIFVHAVYDWIALTLLVRDPGPAATKEAEGEAPAEP